MFSSAFGFFCLLVCRQDYVKTTQPIFTKFGGKVSHGPLKKRSSSGCNPDLDPEPESFNGIFTTLVYGRTPYGWVWLMNSNYTRDCRQLPVSDCKL